MLTDQVNISGGMAQVSSQLRSNFRCFGSIPASEGYGFQVCMHEAGRTRSLKLPVPVCSLSFPRELHLTCAKCPLSSINFLHFGAQTLKDIIKGNSVLHSISSNYMACLVFGSFSNIKWNVALNSTILKYKIIFCEKWSQDVHLGIRQILSCLCTKIFLKFGNW